MIFSVRFSSSILKRTDVLIRIVILLPEIHGQSKVTERLVLEYVVKEQSHIYIQGKVFCVSNDKVHCLFRICQAI